MAIKIELKRSAVPGKVPSTSSLDLGEVAINTYDGKLYFKKDDGAESIVQLADVSGSVVSASYAVTASYALNTQNIDTGSLVSTSSFNAYTSSINTYTSSLNSVTSSFVLNSQTGSMSVLSASYAKTSSFASDFTVTNTLTAQTLVVQTISSSVVYSSGSNIFGNDLTNTQVFTGSVTVTGSLAVNNSNVILTDQTSSMSVLNSSTASYVNPLNQQVIITGSLIQGLEGNIATGEQSHAEGSITKAIGNYSHAEGDNTQAKGDYSHAEGQETIASGSYSHTEGYGAIAIGQSSHAEGRNTQAIGNFSHAEGDTTIAQGLASHAEGVVTLALGSNSHAEGLGTIAKGDYQHVQGQYNATSSAQSAFIVGNGTDDNNRSNLIYAAGNEVQITGSLNVTQGITGSLEGTASYANNANLLDGIDSTRFATTGSNIFKGTQVISGLNPGGPSPALIRLSGSNGQNVIQFYSGSSQLGNIANLDDRLIISNPHSVAKGITLITDITGSIELNTDQVFVHNDLRVSGSILVGTDTLTPTANEKLLIDAENLNSYNLITARSNVNNYSQFNINNKSSGSSASTDVVATNDIGTESTYYVDLGINSSQFAGQVGGPNDAYLFTTGSNLLISNLTNDKNIIISSSGNGIIQFPSNVQVTGSLTVSGSNTFTNIGPAVFSGSINVTEGVTGSLLGTSSYANNADTLDGTHGSQLVLTSSFNSYTSSINNFTSSVNNFTSSITTATGSLVTTSSFNAYTSSINSYTSSLNSVTSSFVRNSQTSSMSVLSASYAATASFAGNFTVSNTLTARTLVVQTISSSVIYSSGSNRFGNDLTNTQVFTGSVIATGSLSLNGSNVVLTNQTSSFVLNSQTSSMSVLSASYAATASNILGGKATHIPFFETDTTLATSSLYQSGSTSVIINQDANTTANPEALYVYQPHPTSINVVSGKGNLNNYLQLNIQNTNQGVSASSDIVATANNGNESSNYIDMGINSQNYSAGFVGDANDAYLYSTGNHLHIGNVSNFPVQLFAGGSDSNLNTKLSLYPNNQHELTGSLDVSGSLKVLNGVTGSFSGSLAGTASFANNATSASFATTSSFVPQAILTASAINTTITFTRFDGSTFNVTTSQSGSVESASFAENARSASYALTASFALNTQQIDTASFTSTSSFNAYTSSINTYTSSLNAATGAFTTYTNFNAYTSSINNATSSFVLNSQTSSFVQNSQTGAFATFTALNAYTSSTNNFSASILSYTSSLNAATGAFATFTALNAYTSSTNAFSASILSYTASQNNLNGTFATTSSLNAYTSSINSYTSSLNAATSSFVRNSQTSSFVQNSQTSSMSVLSASYAQTASFASNFTVANTLTAQTLVVQTVSSSVVYSSGSNVFGNSLANTQVLTGSVLVTGSLSVNGSNVVLTNQTGAFATFTALNAYTSSINTYTQSLNSATSSFATSASFNSYTSSINTYTSSINNVTSSFATTGSNNFKGNQTITGSILHSGSLIQVGSNTITGSFSVSGSTTIIGTTNFSNSSTTITGSLLVTGSTTQIGNNNLFGTTTLSGSITISGSLNTATPTIKVYGDMETDGVIKFLPVSKTIDNTISASYVFVSGSTNDLYFSQNGSGYSNVTRLRWLEGNLYSGLLNGGLIGSSSSTVYTVSSGSGVIVNLNASFNDNPYPTVKYINWPTLSASIAPQTGSYDQSFIAIDSNAQIFAQGTPYADGQYNTAIPLGIVLHQNRSTINGTQTYASLAYGWKQRSSDFIRAFGALKLSGFTMNPSSSRGLTIDGGVAWSDGRNYSVDPNNPSYITDNGTNVSKIFRYHQSGSNWVYDTNAGAGYTTIDPTQYSLNGTLTSVGAGNWSIQRAYWFPNGVTKAVYVYYGNAIYTTEAEAIANLQFEAFTEAPNTAAQAIYLGAIIINGTGVFTSANDYKLLPSGLFRSIGGSTGGGSTVTQTLAGLSDVSITAPSSGQSLIYDSTAGKWRNLSFISASISGNAATATSSSYATTSSFVPTGIVTASAVNTTITFTRFNGSTFDVTVSQSGSVASASYAENAGLLDGLDSTQFTLTSSFNAYSASINTYTQSLNAATGAFATFTALNSYTSSLNTYTQSLNAATGAFVTYTNFNSITSSLNNFSASILSYTASQNNLNGTYATTSSLNAYTSSLNTYTSSLNAATGAFATFTALNAYTSSTNAFSASILSYTQSLNAATGAFVTYANFNADTASINAFSASILSYTASVNNFITGINSYTSSLNSATSSFVRNSQTSSMSVLSSSYAATASFAGNFTVANTLTAQTLVVQTVSSSVIYSSGSNVFGNSLANTQVFTGSVIITGSASVNGSNIVLANQTSSLVTYTNFNSYTSSLNTYTQSLNAATGAFATFTALNAYTSSINTYTSSLNSVTSSFVTYTNFNATTSSLNNFSASILTYTQSLNAATGAFATFTALNAYTSSINTYTSSINTVTSSFVRNSQTSSMTVLSSSYAVTSSYSRNLIVDGTLAFDATLNDYASIASTIVGSNNLFTQPTSSYTSGFFKYTVKNGTNARTGEVMAVWNGTSVEYTDMSTRDLGNTADVTFAASIVTGNLQFNATTATSGWNIKTLATYI